MNGAGHPYPQALVERLRASYRLRWEGTHGWPHWLRVRENGHRLAAETGADLAVVDAFALFHDIARHNEGWDPHHGRRGADVLRALVPAMVALEASQLELAAEACTHHTEGRLEGDITVQTCWDADRLDLGRVGTRPSPDLLCTAAARDPVVIAWAWCRSRGGL